MLPASRQAEGREKACRGSGRWGARFHLGFQKPGFQGQGRLEGNSSRGEQYRPSKVYGNCPIWASTYLLSKVARVGGVEVGNWQKKRVPLPSG